MWNLKYDTNEHTYEIETGEGNGKSTRVFLPGKFHGQRNLVGYSSWGLKESDMTEHTHTHTQCQVGSLSNSQKRGRGGRSISWAYRWYAKVMRTEEKSPEELQHSEVD